ncbi:gliding motility-associated C-terminal domain-containing protein [Chitinophaga sp. YR573]|uniref:right-handed parallel beta-helix repeat-containing protein n=1 Tax=Chitinophaga sp. YR573 TaxID=1881040 RepID=UPI0008D6719A|nr:right-handed parallel beta-helix repeat-containing protein [Chitinophaga sp. YR573]SEW20580.1 gliding motility-associated C-terminal domain-containing protein [Chitinophaga sp. YR573]
MKRYTTYSFCRVTWLVAVLLMSILSVRAQTNISIGAGTFGNEESWYPCPLQDYYDGARAQYLYKASELQAAGMGAGVISALSFKVLNLRGGGLIENYTIKIGTVSASQLNQTTWETVSSVVYGPAMYQPVTGTNTFAFAANFTWNGMDNIVVEICNGDNSGETSDQNPEVQYTTNLPFNASHTYRAYGEGNLCATTNTANTGTLSNRPDIVFAWTAAAACTGTPVAGTPVIDASEICTTGKVNLSLSGTTIASGLTFQWQSSLDNSTWSNITGATTGSYTATQTVNTWYRCVVSCGGSSVFSASVQGVSPSPVSGTFTINSAVATGGSNFQSFNDAVNFIKCGISNAVVFNVVTASGPYNEQVVIPAIPGASATNTITFNGNGNNIHYLSAISTSPAVIKLDGADYIIINDLDIKTDGSGYNEYGFGIHLTNDADFNIINNCRITSDLLSGSQNFAGIVISGGNFLTDENSKSDNNTISNNTITGGYYGITMYGNLVDAAGNNKIINNTIHDFHHGGINAQGTFNLLIEGNEISRPARTTTWQFYGLYLTGLNTKLNVNGNRISNPYGGTPDNLDYCFGIDIESAGALPGLENVISNNLIYNFTAGGNAEGIHVSACNNAWFYHNTIALDGASTAATYTAYGFYVDPYCGGINFKNNIIHVTRAGAGKKYALYVEADPGTVIADHNDYYIANSVQQGATGYYGAADYQTLAQWKVAFGGDATSVAMNPLFFDVTAGNYMPQNNSLNDQGVFVNITKDITGAVRSTTKPDVGAYEFTPPACTAPPTPGTTILSANPICANTQVVLGLTGNSIGVGQTYQWQSSPDGVTFTSLGAVMDGSDTTITGTVSTYYRVALTCSGNASYSTPILLTVNPPVPTGVYTINKGAAASATNYVSFTAASQALQCGITGPVVFNVVANSGPYNEQLILDSIKGSSAVNTVTFNGNGNTIAFSSINSFERSVIKLRSTDHVIIDSLVIDATGTGTYGYGVQLLNNADSNVVSRCKITVPTVYNSGSEYTGIAITGAEDYAGSTGSNCDGNTIKNNTITGGDGGITLMGYYAGIIKGNTIANNDIRDFYRVGIYITGVSNTLISGNKISRPTRTDLNSFVGIVSDGHSGLVIENNRIFNPCGADPSAYASFTGIEMDRSDDNNPTENVVRNNVIYNVNTTGSIDAIYTNGSDNTLYYHNTIDVNLPAVANTSGVNGFVLYGDVTRMIIRNNLVRITRGGTGEKTAMNAMNKVDGITLDNNNYSVKGGVVNYIGRTDNIAYTTLAGWKAASLQEAHSTNVEPVYADVTNGNLAPVISPLDNTGTPVPVSKDINGVTRSTTTPDMGAFEISIPACAAPPVAGTTVVVPATGACLGDSVKLSLTGNTTGGTQTYQWQSAKSATGPWTDFGDLQYIPETIIALTFSNYFRCGVTCGGTTVYSAPASVNMNAAFQSGFYTINPALPAGVTNFQTFNAAVAALECGITGNVTFLVSPGTYNEQVRMHHVAGSGVNARVAFTSANNDATSVTLTYAAVDPGDNYVLTLDSADYVTYNAITLKADGPDYGRVIYMAGATSHDSLTNNTIIAPVATFSTPDIAGIYADQFTGIDNVIKGNTIQNGDNGIWLAGVNQQTYYHDHVIDSNKISGAYSNGIYTMLSNHLKINNNTVDLNAPGYGVSGIFVQYGDSICTVTHNHITINNAHSPAYGINFTYSGASIAGSGSIEGNTILALNGNTSDLYGIYTGNNQFLNAVNNVVSIKTTSSVASGLYVQGEENASYTNNSIYNTSPTSGTKNTAAYLRQSKPTVVVRNNIFAHGAGRRALYVYNYQYENTDFNTLYTTGTVLASTRTADYASLPAFVAATKQEQHSMVYKPAFVSASDLRPDVTSTDVWALNGRGVQVPGNNHDFNNQLRPTTLETGVPDMGAFEFAPTSVPVALTGIPAIPVAGSTQTFMFGSDTVATLKWDAASAIPSAITLQRYTGTVPTGLSPAAQYMYFYTNVNVTGSGAYNYTLKQYYMDPWQGTVKNQSLLQLGRTDAADKWITGDSSTVNDPANYLTESKLSFLGKFTGLVDSARAVVPVVISPADSSNTGTRFWVGYGHHEYFTENNAQNMVLYLSAANEDADVTVKINNTSWIKTYHIPANTAITSDLIPKQGLEDARLLTEGVSDKGISIESTKPIVAYAHIYSHESSGATMLLPVGTYGYEYYALGYNQSYSYLDYSWSYVVADQPNTLVEITPSVPTEGGHPANVPFTVVLNKGEIYQVLGARIGGGLGYDITGTRFRSVSNASGKCYPIGVFTGSSRTSISCAGSGSGGNGDNIIQQNFPSQAWGKRYLTAPTSTDEDPGVLMGNVYRVQVKDPATVVKRNGTVLTGLINNRYYQYNSTTADYIQADQPIMVAQYMASWTECFNTGGYGDPEMIYLSPIEQGIKKTGFYRNTQESIEANLLTLIIPDGGVSTLKIDGSSTFDYTYKHPALAGYTVVVKRWDAEQAQSSVQSDSAFTAITYGLGENESYGYNAGTLVRNLNTRTSITNTNSDSTSVSDHTCANTPFRFTFIATQKPASIVWGISQVSNITPATDVTQTNPVPVDSFVANSRKYYRFAIKQDYTFTKAGTYYVPVTMIDPTLEGCDNKLVTYLPVTVIAAPVVSFTYAFNGCVSDSVRFKGMAVTSNAAAINKWSWAFGDAATSLLQNPVHLYGNGGTYAVNFDIIAADGCTADTTGNIVVKGPASGILTTDSITTCIGTAASFSVQSPATGVDYNWYDALTGGALVGTGSTLNISAANVTATYYLETIKDGCPGPKRTIAKLVVLPLLTAPVAQLDSAGVNTLRFKWAAVPNATGYEVSTDGLTWTSVSGLSYTISGLKPSQEVTLHIRALGCETVNGANVSGTTLLDGIYIPNVFTPNGDGVNETFKVYGYIVKTIHLMIFDQWGEKLFESDSQDRGWDGVYKGKQQPSGVYMYVCRLQLLDGSTVEKKGIINLIR